MFGAAYGGMASVSGQPAAGTGNATSRTYGTIGGLDYLASPDTTIGFALGGGGTSFSLGDGFGSGRSDLFQFGVHGRHAFGGAAYVAAALAYGWQDVTTDRTAPTGERLQGAYSAHSLSGRFEAGWELQTIWGGITPYVAAQTTRYHLPGYHEKGNGANDSFALTFNEKQVSATRSELGLRLASTVQWGDALLGLHGRAAWAHNYDKVASLAASFQALPGTRFGSAGATPAPDAALVTAGAELSLASGVTLGATFEGEFSSNLTSYLGKASVNYTW